MAGGVPREPGEGASAGPGEGGGRGPSSSSARPRPRLKPSPPPPFLLARPARAPDRAPSGLAHMRQLPRVPGFPRAPGPCKLSWSPPFHLNPRCRLESTHSLHASPPPQSRTPPPLSPSCPPPRTHALPRDPARSARARHPDASLRHRRRCCRRHRGPSQSGPRRGPALSSAPAPPRPTPLGRFMNIHETVKTRSGKPVQHSPGRMQIEQPRYSIIHESCK